MKTLVVGASEKPQRYSYKAIVSLQNHGHEVIARANKAGEVNGVSFITENEPIESLHTVTLYINPAIQRDYYDYIIGLVPKRVIFNPGTENEEFERLLKQNNIESVIACTLVLLSINEY